MSYKQEAIIDHPEAADVGIGAKVGSCNGKVVGFEAEGVYVKVVSEEKKCTNCLFCDFCTASKGTVLP